MNNMNMQAMIKQAHALQKNMLDAKKKVDEMTFTGESSMVTVTMKGSREVTAVKINPDMELSKDDLDMLEDMLVVAINDATKKVEKAIEDNLGKYTKGMPGLF